MITIFSLLYNYRVGFIPGDSTVNQQTYLYNVFCQALDSGNEVRAVFCEISNASDRVWYAGLLLKQQAAGVSGKVLAWFKSYLSDRRQRVVIPGATSDCVFVLVFHSDPSCPPPPPCSFSFIIMTSLLTLVQVYVYLLMILVFT